MISRFSSARLIAALVLSAGACTSALAQTGADTCATAGTSVIPAGGGTVNGLFLGGGADGGAAIDCEATGALASGSDVFFSFTPTIAGPWVFATCASTAVTDTVVSVHSGCPANASNILACDDDTDGCGAIDFLSRTDPVTLSPGTTYIVRVARWSGPGTQAFILNVNSLASSGACCDPATGGCSVVDSMACTSPNTFQGVGTVCTPNPCPLPPPPANDTCASPTLAAIGANLGTLAGATNDGDSSCDGDLGADVYFSFTPSTTGTYRFSLCGGSVIDTVVSLHTGCITDGTNQVVGGCNDDFCGLFGLSSIQNVGLTGGTTYVIRVAYYDDATNATDPNFTLNISQTNAGACCNTLTGACTITEGAAACTAGTYQGDATLCSPSPCPASGACCNTTSGACLVRTAASCASPDTYQGDATTCTPNPCPQPPPPANDECTAAVALTLGVSTNGVLTAATGLASSSCSGTDIDVWYSFTPATSGVYRVTTAALSPDVWSTAIAVFNAPCEPAADSDIACVAQLGLGDTNEVLASLTGGSSYLIRAGAFVGDESNFSIIVESVGNAGACCGIAGGCFIVLASECVDGPVYQGDNTTCTPSPCPTTGSCCFPGSSICFTSIQAFCSGVSGTWVDGGLCTPNPCAGSTPGNDACSNATPVTTLPYVSNVGTDLALNEGPVPAAGSCNAAGAAAEGLDNSIFYRYTATFTGDLRVRHTNYGTYDALLVVYSGTDCNALTELNCQDEPEPYDFLLPVTAGTTYFFGIGDWGITDGGGWNTFRLDQVTGGGNIACCRGATCSVIAAAACTDPAGTAGAFATTATACNVGSSTTPCCLANYNKVGGIEVNDIFDFLNDWFAGSNFADTGGDGTTAPDVNSIFDFLNAWFAGGC